MRDYSGQRYIWSMNQAAIAAHRFPHMPATWQGLEALQERVAIDGAPLPVGGPRDLAWARAAFADADARFNFRYEQVVA